MARAAWTRLPVLVRAIVSGQIVLEIGSGLCVLPLLGNLKFHPGIPWAFPATCVVVAGFWAWASGHGPPARTKEARRTRSRNGRLPARLWVAAVPAIAFGTVMLLALRLAAPYLMPVAAPSVSLALASFSTPAAAGALLAIAVSAAVIEETALRGYMQKPLEDRYGVAPAILIVGVIFWFEHLDKVTVTHLPGHLAASALFGLLAVLTRSLAPAMVAHFAADLVLQPAYFSRSPQFVWTALSARPVWEGSAATLGQKLDLIGRAANPANTLFAGPFQIFATLMLALLLSALATVLAFLVLARAVRSQPPTQ